MNANIRICKIALLSLVFGLLAWPVFAGFVQPAVASSAAQNWLAQVQSAKSGPGWVDELLAYQSGVFGTAAPSYANESNALPSLYLAKFSNGGFVLVSADDNATPVLAWSDGSNSNVRDFPPAFLAWVGDYSSRMTKLVEAGVDVPESRQLWQSLLAGEARPFAALDRAMDPLISTNWDQGWPYNELCPLDAAGPGGRVYAGCVATAMGMVMKYWNHPQTGVGSNTYYHPVYGFLSADFGATTYLWDEMPNSVGSSNIPVATLLYHCGVAVEMDYAVDGSGASSDYAASAMANNFRYPDASIQHLDEFSSIDDWHTLLRAQLDNGSPVYYSGFGSGGHAFVVDGYQDDGYYHFNFGWSGSYNGNYLIGAINPGGSDFSYGNSAIVNTIPENYSIANTRVKIESVGGETAGNNFTLTVITNPILGSWNVDHYEFTLFYDHTNIEYISSSTANSISDKGNFTVTEPEPGNLMVSWDGTSPLVGGGLLASFTFLPRDAGEYYFDILDMKLNSDPVTNTQYLMVEVEAPVATLAESQISLTNVMHLAYQSTGVTDLRTTYLLPSWNVTHYQFDINFDPAKLEFVGVQTEGSLSAGLEPSAAVNTPGVLSVSCDAESAIIGADTLLRIGFKAIGNGPQLTVTQISTANFYFNSTKITSLGSANFILSPYTSATGDDLGTPPPVLTVYPNPATASARINFSGKAGSDTELKVYNLKGQLIDSISVKSGTEHVWDLSDSSGNRLPAGIYLMAWKQGTASGTMRFLVLP